MQKTILIILITLIQISILGQNKMSYTLENDIKNRPHKMQDILVGSILGGLIGFGIFNLIYYTSDIGPTLVFFAKEDNAKKCKLSKTKFKCSYQ